MFVCKGPKRRLFEVLDDSSADADMSVHHNKKRILNDIHILLCNNSSHFLPPHPTQGFNQHVPFIDKSKEILQKQALLQRIQMHITQAGMLLKQIETLDTHNTKNNIYVLP